jgi:hypothetical protein
MRNRMRGIGVRGITVQDVSRFRGVANLMHMRRHDPAQHEG